MEPRNQRFEAVTTVALAVVTLVVAAVLWRAAILSSAAHDADRAAIINTVRIRSTDLEDLTTLYREAHYALRYRQEEVRIQEMVQAAQGWRAAGPDTLATVAETEASWLSEAIAAMCGMFPIVGNPDYRRPDGSLDLQRRLQEIRAAGAERSAMDPRPAFDQAERTYTQVRLLILGTIPLGIVIFACTLAQIFPGRVRYILFGLAVILFLATLVHLGLVELAGPVL
ncbi:MAG: hypothetical protein ACP5NB_03430 [Chloroflexia bacterium]